jgi:hypothetical protein
MADYCSSSDCKADIPDSGLYTSTDTTYDVALGGFITAASRLIDQEVGREPNWFSTTDSETRYYDGSGSGTVNIDECHTLTAVEVSEGGGTSSTSYTAWTLDTDYYVAPYSYNQMGVPINRLIADWNSDKIIFPEYRKAVKVTAQFGYSSTPPEDIKLACKMLAIRWFGKAKQLYMDAGGGGDLGTLTYTGGIGADVRTLLQSYKIGNMV